MAIKEPARDVSSAIEVIVASGNSAVEDGQGLEEFVTQQRDASSLLVFAPAKQGDWVEEVMALASRLPIQVCIVGKAPYKKKSIGNGSLYSTGHRRRSDGASQRSSSTQEVGKCWCIQYQPFFPLG